MSKSKRRQTNRHSQIETLESREVMSADPLGGLLGGAISHHAIQEEVQHHAALEAPGIVHHGVPELELHGVPELDHHTLPPPDFWLDAEQPLSIEEQLEQIEKSLSSAHQLTGMDQVRANYGFSGVGQTVAVIDSGIAYDHYALGGGMGAGYRVVGGWDFTENDADFYDDGTEGAHGTHVAGIVGASDGSRSGVATGVDLVGLRVFSDTGAGYFSWVESALKWVHTNRNSFENPITAINLSLGTNWNASSIPAWAMLEDEFAQLKADGIFIAVSAGNDYSSYNTPGLSYPAASQHVVPVMSTDDSGLLSYFSQRHQRGIAAPGRYIYSTVPDYAGNHNGVTDDWANFSGTSMAAPYVAGSSVIIREAMEFVGMTNITQDTIYNHMIATADTFTDAASGATYNRLNMQSAIDALMPEDDFGSSVEDAYSLGTIFAGPQAAAAPMSGHIAKLGDADYFTFTAGATGTITFTAANTTHHLAAAWQGLGGEGWSGDAGKSYTMNVVAGQEYTVALSSSDGLGFYDLAITAESTFSYTDWGVATTQETHQGITVGAETYYRLKAGQSGYLTVESLTGAGVVNLDLYDASLGLVNTGSSGRVDYYAASGEELYLKVSGSASGVDFRITNAVSVSGGVVTVVGTEEDDAFSFTAGGTHSLSLNGVNYSFASASYSTFDFAGRLGNDTITVTGTAADETAHLHSNSLDFSGGGTTVQASGVENKVVNSGGGAGDVAFFYDTVGNDLYVSRSDRAEMTGAGYSSRANGFATTAGYGSQGVDSASFYDSAGMDHFRSYADRSEMVGGGRYSLAQGFDNNTGHSSQGTDTAFLFDSAGDNAYTATPTSASMTGDGLNNRANGFSIAYAYSSTGNDTAQLDGGAGNDTFVAYKGSAALAGADYFNQTSGFMTVSATASSGTDIAILYDTAGDDQYTAYSDRVEMAGAGYQNTAHGFDVTTAHASGGTDIAVMHDSAGDDHFRSYSDRVEMVSTDYYNIAAGFDSTQGVASTGADVAFMFDSAGANDYSAFSNKVVMSGDGINSEASGFDVTYGYSTGGADTASFYDSVGDDHFRTYASLSITEMAGSGYHNQARGFATSLGFASGGNDTVFLHDSAGNDTYRAYADRVEMTGSGYFYQATGFETSYAYASTGNDVAHLYDSAGDNSYFAYAHGAVMSGDGLFNQAMGFKTTHGYASSGSDNAYLYDSVGNDRVTAAGAAVGLLYGDGKQSDASGFDAVAAFASAGDDTTDVAAVDFYFNLIGEWS